MLVDESGRLTALLLVAAPRIEGADVQGWSPETESHLVRGDAGHACTGANRGTAGQQGDGLGRTALKAQRTKARGNANDGVAGGGDPIAGGVADQRVIGGGRTAVVVNIRPGSVPGSRPRSRSSGVCRARESSESGTPTMPYGYHAIGDAVDDAAAVDSRIIGDGDVGKLQGAAVGDAAAAAAGRITVYGGVAQTYYAGAARNAVGAGGGGGVVSSVEDAAPALRRHITVYGAVGQSQRAQGVLAAAGGLRATVVGDAGSVGGDIIRDGIIVQRQGAAAPEKDAAAAVFQCDIIGNLSVGDSDPRVGVEAIGNFQAAAAAIRCVAVDEIIAQRKSRRGASRAELGDAAAAKTKQHPMLISLSQTVVPNKHKSGHAPSSITPCSLPAT